MCCEKCGKPVEGEQKLCNCCEAEQLAEVPETAEESVSNCDTFELNTADCVPVKSPKKKGGLIAAVAALVVVVAVAIGIALNLDGIKGFIGRTFQDPEDYLVDVESAAVADYSADLAQAYGKMLNNYNTNQTQTETEIRLTLGNEILSLIESALQQQGMAMDIEWLREIKVSLNANVQDAAMQTELGIGLGKTDLLAADVILDMEGGKIYMGVPALNEEYISVEMPYDMPVEDFQNILTQSKEIVKDFTKDLPSEEELNDLIQTYTGIILSGIENVEKEKDTVTIDGVSQKMVVLTAKISEEDLLDIVEDVLEKAEKDKTIKKVIKAFSDYTNKIGELSGGYYYPVDLYQEFVDAIPYALESVEEAKEQADRSNYLKLKVYVDMKNQVRGHELAVYSDGEQEFDPISWMTVVKGDVTYTEAELGEAQITGEKTEKKGISEGYYDLSVSGEKIGTMKFENVTESGGTLRLIPSEEIMSEALSESGIPTALLGDNLALELTYNMQDTNKVSYEVEVLVGSKALIGLALSAEASDGGKISIPSGALDATNENDLMQWVKDAKFDNLLGAMENAGVPKDLVDAVRSYVEMIQEYLN